MIVLKHILFLLIYLGLCFETNGYDFDFNFDSLISGFTDEFNKLQDMIEGEIKDASQFLKNYSQVLNNINEETASKMTPENAKKLLDENSNMLNERAKSVLECRKDADKMDFERFSNGLREINIKNNPCAQKVINDFDVTSMTESQLNELGKDALKIDTNKLSSAQINQLFGKMQGYINSEEDKIKQQGLKNKKRVMCLQKYGNPASLNNETIENLEVIKCYDEHQISQIPGITLYSKLPELGQQGDEMTPLQRRAIWTNIAEMSNIKQMNDTEFRNFYNNVPNEIRKGLKLEDLPESQREDRKESLYTARRTDADVNKFIDPQACKDVMFLNITSKTRSTYGDKLMACSSPARFEDAIRMDLINEGSMGAFLEGLKIACGIGCRNKYKVLARMIEKNKNENIPVFSNYDKEILREISIASLRKVSEDESKSILRKTTNLSVPKLKVLLDKITSGFSDLPLSVRKHLPHMKIRFEEGLLPNIAKNLPNSIPCSMALARSTIYSDTNITNDDARNYKDIMHCLGPTQGKRFSNWTLIQALESMENEPGIASSLALLKILANRTMYTGSGDGSLGDLSKFFVERDALKFPMSVIAAVGPANYKRISYQVRKLLLSRLLDIDNEEELEKISPSVKSTIINGAIEGMQAGDTAKLGKPLLQYVRGDAIHNGDPTEVPTFLEQLQEWMKEKERMPCLDAAQRGAIGQAILWFFGQGREAWAKVNKIDCLLPTLPASALDWIPNEALAQFSCESFYRYPEDPSEVECRASIGGSDYMDRKEQSMEFMKKFRDASRGLVEEEQNRRQIDSSKLSDDWACERASIYGVEGFSNSEIYNLKGQQILACPHHFGFADMTIEKAKYLAGKVLEVIKSPANTSIEIANDLGYVFKGLTKKQLGMLPKFNESYIPLVVKFGKMEGLDGEQKRAFIDKFKSRKNVESWSGQDLVFLYKRLCDLTRDELRKISVQSYRDAAKELGRLADCSKLFYEEMASKSRSAFLIYDKAEIQEIGVVASRLTKNNWKSAAKSATEGLSGLAIEEMPTELLEEFGDEMAQNAEFPLTHFLEKSQIDSLSQETLDFLEDLKSLLKSSANNVIQSCLLMTMMAMLGVLLIN